MDGRIVFVTRGVVIGRATDKGEGGEQGAGGVENSVSWGGGKKFGFCGSVVRKRMEGSGDEDFERVLHAGDLFRRDVADGREVFVAGAKVPVALHASGGRAERAQDAPALQEQREELLEHGLVAVRIGIAGKERQEKFLASGESRR